jgi:CDP-4-dehydro-6-deoxyglucose reductase
MDSDVFEVLIEPGSVALRVPRDANVLGAALAAGLPLPHSCRAGRCASCKSRLLSGRIEYPDGTPPGITSAEIARGEVLLCQARPRSDLRIETRRVPPSARWVEFELLDVERLVFGMLKANLRRGSAGAFAARPGQFVDLDNADGLIERVAVVDVGPARLAVEVVQGSALAEWLGAAAEAGARLLVSGPFDGTR